MSHWLLEMHQIHLETFNSTLEIHTQAPRGASTLPWARRTQQSAPTSSAAQESPKAPMELGAVFDLMPAPVRLAEA